MSLTVKSGGVEKTRRKGNWWNDFNVWWRIEYVNLGNKKPAVSAVVKWYTEQAHVVWPDASERPTIKETKRHSKGLRPKREIREYFRKYRAERGRSGQRRSNVQRVGSTSASASATPVKAARIAGNGVGRALNADGASGLQHGNAHAQGVAGALAHDGHAAAFQEFDEPFSLDQLDWDLDFSSGDEDEEGEDGSSSSANSDSDESAQHQRSAPAPGQHKLEHLPLAQHHLHAQANSPPNSGTSSVAHKLAGLQAFTSPGAKNKLSPPHAQGPAAASPTTKPQSSSNSSHTTSAGGNLSAPAGGSGGGACSIDDQPGSLPADAFATISVMGDASGMQHNGHHLHPTYAQHHHPFHMPACPSGLPPLSSPRKQQQYQLPSNVAGSAFIKQEHMVSQMQQQGQQHLGAHHAHHRNSSSGQLPTLQDPQSADGACDEELMWNLLSSTLDNQASATSGHLQGGGAPGGAGGRTGGAIRPRAASTSLIPPTAMHAPHSYYPPFQPQHSGGPPPAHHHYAGHPHMSAAQHHPHHPHMMMMPSLPPRGVSGGRPMSHSTSQIPLATGSEGPASSGAPSAGSPAGGPPRPSRLGASNSMRMRPYPQTAMYGPPPPGHFPVHPGWSSHPYPPMGPPSYPHPSYAHPQHPSMAPHYPHPHPHAHPQYALHPEQYRTPHPHGAPAGAANTNANTGAASNNNVNVNMMARASSWPLKPLPASHPYHTGAAPAAAGHPHPHSHLQPHASMPAVPAAAAAAAAPGGISYTQEQQPSGYSTGAGAVAAGAGASSQQQQAQSQQQGEAAIADVDVISLFDDDELSLALNQHAPTAAHAPPASHQQQQQGGVRGEGGAAGPEASQQQQLRAFDSWPPISLGGAGVGASPSLCGYDLDLSAAAGCN